MTPGILHTFLQCNILSKIQNANLDACFECFNDTSFTSSRPGEGTCGCRNGFSLSQDGSMCEKICSEEGQYYNLFQTCQNVRYEYSIDISVHYLSHVSVSQCPSSVADSLSSNACYDCNFGPTQYTPSDTCECRSQATLNPEGSCQGI